MQEKPMAQKPKRKGLRGQTAKPSKTQRPMKGAY